jgi:Ni/Co efflux regulator RcnB
MKAKLLLIAGAALALSAPLAKAQEDWGEGRRERWRALREDCENGDDEACMRLRHMRREHEEREEQERREERWRERQEDRERGERAPTPSVDPKVATCLAIETNYNNCLRQQHDGCPAWVVQLKANHCF